jgi:hypothetical protein
MKLSTLERKARATIKDCPAVHHMEREKSDLMKRVAAGKMSQRWASEIKRLLRLQRRRLLNREMYRLMTSPAT